MTSHLGDRMPVSSPERRFARRAEGCALCGVPVNEQLTVWVAGSEVSIFACPRHADGEVVDEIVWCLARQFRKAQGRRGASR